MHRPSPWFAGSILSAWATVAPLGYGQPPPPIDPTVAEAVRTYLTTDSGDIRGESLKTIEGAFGNDISALASCWRTLPLWAAIAPGDRVVSFDVGMGEPLECLEVIPQDYDAARPARLVIVLTDESESPAEAVGQVRRIIHSAQQAPIFVAPLRPLQASFDSPAGESVAVETLLRELRRRYRLDESGVCLWGRGTGGDAAWQWAFFHPDRFASLVIQNGLADVPYPEHLVAMLMSNLRGCPVLPSFNSPPPDPAPLPGASPNLSDAVVARAIAVASFNRSLCVWARSTEFTILCKEHAGQTGRPDADDMFTKEPDIRDLRMVLDARRPPWPKTIDYRFRYPTQGSCFWLRQARFLGSVWELPEISILPAATADRDTVIRETLGRKLARLSGRIEGQTINLTVERCDRVEVRIFDGMVDFSRPVRLMCNGKKRFDGLLRPSIATALEFARQEWCFDRPLAARLAFNIDAVVADPPRPYTSQPSQ